MKTAVLTTLAAALVVAVPAPATAATPSNQQLSRQIKAMQRQVKTLQRQVKTLQTQVRNAQSVAAGGVVFTACTAAATSDAFQGTWETIDRLAAQNGNGADQYPPQTAIADPLNSCQALELQRQPNIVPPTTNVFSALLNIFR